MPSNSLRKLRRRLSELRKLNQRDHKIRGHRALEQEGEVTDLEKNIACAEECGMDTSQFGKDIYFCTKCKKQVDANHGFDHQVFITSKKRPDFSTDWNTRPIMWAAMKEAQRQHFVQSVISNKLAMQWIQDAFSMNQPTFRDTFLKVKGRL